MDPVHLEVLQRKQGYLVINLITRDVEDGLTSSLIFSHSDFQCINSKERDDDQVRELLQMMRCKGPNAYNTFIQALNEAGKGWIVVELNAEERKVRAENRTSANVNANAGQFLLNPVTMEGKGKTALTGEEKIQLFGLYNTWITDVDLNLLMPKLRSEGFCQSQDYRGDETDKNKIFYDVLLSSYEDVCEVRRMLKDTGNQTQIELAAKLPVRANLETQSDPTQENNEEPMEFPDQQSNSPAGGDVAKGAFAKIFGKTLPSPKIQNIYGFKPSSKAPCGKGLCVIIWNFTDDLPGYGYDAKKLEDFFRYGLNYTVFGPSKDIGNLRNLNYKNFDSLMKEIQRILEASHYDRFFLFVLSHGDEQGIRMSRNGSGRDSEPTRYKVRDIVKKFSHDSLKAMRGFPKCIFIQACRGGDAAKPASLPHFSASDSSLSEKAKAAHNPGETGKLAPGRDILVCYPTAEDALSWVRSDGSLFIGESVKVFQEYYQSDHLLDMMVEVARRVSAINTAGEYEDKTDGSMVTDIVCQMPHFTSALSQKFYLYMK